MSEITNAAGMEKKETMTSKLLNRMGNILSRIKIRLEHENELINQFSDKLDKLIGPLPPPEGKIGEDSSKTELKESTFFGETELVLNNMEDYLRKLENRQEAMAKEINRLGIIV